MAYANKGGYSTPSATSAPGYGATSQTPLLSTTGLYDLAAQLRFGGGSPAASPYRATSCTCGQCPMHGIAGAAQAGALESMLGTYGNQGYAARSAYTPSSGKSGYKTT